MSFIFGITSFFFEMLTLLFLSAKVFLILLATTLFFFLAALLSNTIILCNTPVFKSITHFVFSPIAYRRFKIFLNIIVSGLHFGWLQPNSRLSKKKVLKNVAEIS